MIESEWQPWQEIRENMEACHAEEEMTATQVLEGLNAVWPGIEDQVEMTNMATPYTWWRYKTHPRPAGIENLRFFSR